MIKLENILNLYRYKKRKTKNATYNAEPLRKSDGICCFSHNCVYWMAFKKYCQKAIKKTFNFRNGYYGAWIKNNNWKSNM